MLSMAYQEEGESLHWRHNRGLGCVILPVHHLTGAGAPESKGVVLISRPQCQHRAWHKHASVSYWCMNKCSKTHCAWFGVEKEGENIQRPGHRGLRF